MRDLPTVCEQLHLPVQAGDDDLLRRMRRLYTVDEYREKIGAAVDAVGPRLALSTDIIVGFCGETEAEFAGTESLMRELRFDTVHLAAYSVRPGHRGGPPRRRRPARGEASPPQPPARASSARSRLTRNGAYVGQDVEILVEGVAEDGRPYGRTRENKVAWLPVGAARSGELRAGACRGGKRVAAAGPTGRRRGVRTSSKVRAPHLVSAVSETPRRSLDLEAAGRYADPPRVPGRQSRISRRDRSRPPRRLLRDVRARTRRPPRRSSG